MISFYKRSSKHCCFFIVRHVGTSTAQHAQHTSRTHVKNRTTCRDATSGIWAIAADGLFHAHFQSFVVPYHKNQKCKTQQKQFLK